MASICLGLNELMNKIHMGKLAFVFWRKIPMRSQGLTIYRDDTLLCSITDCRHFTQPAQQHSMKLDRIFVHFVLQDFFCITANKTC